MPRLINSITALAFETPDTAADDALKSVTTCDVALLKFAKHENRNWNTGTFCDAIIAIDKSTLKV